METKTLGDGEMSIKFRSRVFRKPAHWTEERYNEYLKENNLCRSRDELLTKIRGMK